MRKIISYHGKYELVASISKRLVVYTRQRNIVPNPNSVGAGATGGTNASTAGGLLYHKIKYFI
jgi:hypothetical protein